MKYAVMIRDTICDDIEKGNINCEKNTKYAYKIDEQSLIYQVDSPAVQALRKFAFQTEEARVQAIHKATVTLNTKMCILTDVKKELEKMFPDSKIEIVDKETTNGFVVTTATYIEVDWS